MTEKKKKQPRNAIEMVVIAALAEDIGPGDITTDSIVAGNIKGSAQFIAKENFVVAGLTVVELTFKTVDAGLRFTSLVSDGDRVKKGRKIAEVKGSLSSILKGERTALNFLQRLSGIATITSEFVKQVQGTNAVILDTRKTTPCLRALEKHAVIAGGGQNHRFGLFDAVLIKDNHIAAAGGIKRAMDGARKKLPPLTPIEVETTNINEVKEALASGADIIMLDNMSLKDIRKAVKIIGGTAIIEASGGVTLKNVANIAKAGVDCISVGKITHSARAMDISLEIR